MKFSKPVSKDFTNASQIALQAQSNAMFYVGDTAPIAPKTGMVWVKINQANDNWLAHGKTSNTLKSGVVAKGSWSYTVAYGTDWLVSKGSVMTASVWLDLTGENISDLGLNLISHQSNNQWWASGNQNVTLPDGTVTPTTVPIKAGQKGWVTLTFQFPSDTNLNQLEFYISRLGKDGPATQDIPIQYSSPKIDWDTKRTEWCDGTNYDKGNIEGAQKWDGSKWVPTAFTSDVIADYIYGKNIIGSTFANADGSFKVDSNGNINGANITGSEFHADDEDGSTVITGSEFLSIERFTGSANKVMISAGQLSANSIVLASGLGGDDQDQNGQNIYHPWKWSHYSSQILNGFFTSSAINVVRDQGKSIGFSYDSVTSTLSPTYLKITGWKGSTEKIRTYIDANQIETGNLTLVANSIYNTGQSDIYFTHGDTNTGYNGHAATIHAAVVNSSTLSVKTDLQKMTEQDAINAIKNIDEYSYQYTADAESGSKQRYVSGIIDDVHDVSEYRMDPLFVYESGQDRVDSNLLNVQTVVIQNLLRRVENLEKAQAVSA